MGVIVDALKVSPAAVATAAGVIQASAGGNLILNLPGSNRLNARSYALVASGIAQTASGTYTATIQPVLYGDASLATVTTKPLFSASAGTLAFTGTVAGAIPWSLYAEFEGDSTSATIVGIASSTVGVTLKTQTITVAPVSAINYATEPPVKFALGFATTGTVGAGFKFTVSDFHLEEL